MDKNVRTLLAIAKKSDAADGADSLLEAYGLMRSIAATQPSNDGPDAFGQDLYVICAEIALQLGQIDMTKECLKMFFMKTPPTNQFLCRAYLCQASLLAPSTANSVEDLEKAVVYLIKAISIAKDNPRYHFIVYNASVLYWQFCRPFLKPQYRQHLARSLHQVVKALDDIEDKDYEWRAQLMIALIECHMDAGRKQDASHIASAASTFIRQHVPHLYKTVFGLLVRHQLVESDKFRKDVRTSPELNVYYRICKLKGAIDNKELEREPAEEMKKILSLISGVEDQSRKDKPVDKPGRATPDDSTGALKRGSPSRAKTRSPSPTGPRKPLNQAEKPYLLLELARLALEHNQPEIAEQCTVYIRECANQVQDQSYFLEFEFLQCDLLVRALKDKQESYHPSVIDLRVQSIKRCDEAIINAVRLQKPNVIQAGCVTQWNLCLPLLQSNLRHNCRRPLTTVAEALENMQSLLIQLRCQVHMELARCEEEQEQIQVAIEHLKKALALDDGNVYEERLQVSLHRLQLRAELYEQPSRPEDQAATIIEQARKADSGTLRMKRSLLVRAGQALAPDAFLLVLDSENDTKEAGKGVLTPIKKLAGKAQQFKKCVCKAEGHLRRLGNENDRERAALWGDLAKTARKQEVWDVCRVAARFCLLYDDSRWKIEPPPKETSRRSKSQDRETAIGETTEGETPAPDIQREKSNLKKADKSRAGSPERTLPLYDRDLIRTMAEVNFINAEALIQLLRSEQVELGDKPIAPQDKRKHPKGYVVKKPEDDPEWIEYCDWINSLSQEALNGFLRSSILGLELREAWIICSAAAYIWNYNNHVLSQDRHKELVEVQQTILSAFKKVGHAGETVLLVNVCNALATGLLQPWLPPQQTRETILPEEGDSGKDTPRKGRGPQAAGSKSKAAVPFSVPSEAGPDLKKACEVCEHALKITNGDNPLDVIPVSVRYPLIQTWVTARQMAQQQIPKTFGTDDDDSMEGQKPMTRAMVAVEMLMRNNMKIMEFRECPSIQQAIDLVSACTWTDKLVELQLWTKLAYLALDTKDHAAVLNCSKQALVYAEKGTQPQGKKQDSHKYTVEQEMLCFAASICGQSLIKNTLGKNSIRRKAMQQFLDSARFAGNAKNYDLVMTAARHYWNACIPLISQPLERELLKEPLTILLQCITETTDKNKYKKEENEEEEITEDPGPQLKAIAPVDPTTGESGAADGEVQPSLGVDKEETAGGQTPSAGAVIGGPDDDLTLRASLYGVLFQSYSDKGEWDAGLKAMEQAVNDMPRTQHRLLIFKHLVVVKAKLGVGVSMSIQKFKDEREDYIAQMWRRVALCSRDQLEQLQAYQNAIEALSSSWTDWQKYDLLLEFSQWLYCNDFPLQDALDQIDWAIDILLNLKYETEQPKQGTAKSKKASRGKPGKTPPPTTPKSAPKKASSKTRDAKAEKASAGKSRKDSGKKSPREKVKPDKTEKKEAGQTDSESEQPVADIVPVHKEAVIGVLCNNPALTVQDLSNITQLEGLFRAYTLQAQMVGRCSEAYRDLCLLAYNYIVRMWQVSLGRCGPVMKEIIRQQALEAQENAAKASAKGKKGKDKDKEDKKEKPKRKGPLDHMPSSVEEWAGYDAPDEVLESFKHRLMRQTGINEFSIVKPTLTLYYLDQLVSILCDLGSHQMSLPVLALADLLTRDVVNDRPMNALVHLKSMEVCVGLNLQSSAAFHEKLALFKLNEDEQARAHQEMALWKERQLQVEKEEQRIKETLAAYKNKNTHKPMTQRDKELANKPRSGTATTSAFSTRTTSTAARLREMEENTKPSHLGKAVGAIQIRDVWTDTAEVLIRNGIYQPARELLNEAHVTAKAFEDSPLVARVLYLLGKLSYYEAQYGLAINFCRQAQMLYDGDEMFWYETTMLMVDAHLNDFSQKDKVKFRKARNLLVHAHNIFKEFYESHPNKISTNGYIIAQMEAKLGLIQIKIALSEHENILQTKVMSALNSACKKLREGSERLVQLGYHREALTVMKDLAEVYVNIARITPMNEDKHDFFIQALSVLSDAVQISNDALQDLHSLAEIMEMRVVNSPLQRETTEIHLLCAELMLEMYALHVKEERDKQLDNMAKGPVLRAVEELVRESPDYSTAERLWIDTINVLGDSVLTLLSTAHTLSNGIVELKARCVANIGRCLRLLGIHKGPDEPAQWKLQELEILGITGPAVTPTTEPVSDDKQASERSGEASLHDNATDPFLPQPDELDTTSHDYAKQSAQISHAQMFLDISHQYLAQATECLTQAVNLALNKGLLDTASQAALDLVECYGQFDAGLASQYLAIHQSCQASLYLENLLRKSLYDPQLSQIGALFHQRHNLLEQTTTSNARHGPVMKNITTTLQDTSEAWRRLNVSTHHLDLLKEFPSNYTFVVLQHSPDRYKLYGAVLDKGKSGGGGGKGSQKNSSTQSKAKIVAMDTNPKRLDDLLSKHRWYRHGVMQTLLKFEYQKTLLAQREKMLANLEENMKGNMNNPMAAEWEEDEKKLHEEFFKIVDSMEAYLRPIMSQISTMLRPPSTTPSETTRARNTTAEPPQEYIILLADHHLLELPLEALDCFNPESIVSLTRDISLQMLYNKFHIEPLDEAAEKAKKEKEKNKPPSRIPGLRDASKKMAKIIPLDRPVQPGFIGVDTHSFRFICDPHLDCSETEQHKPVEQMNKILEEHEQQFTPRWLGVPGDDHTPSEGEYEVYLLESSGFVFYGMERFLCHLPPHKVAALNLPECQFVMVLDLAQTNKSFSRQAKRDVLKTADVLSLEKPTETAMLLSLTGVNCVCVNQWHCTLKENAERIQVFMRDLLHKGKSSGQTVRMLFTPNIRRQEELAELQAQLEAEQAKGQGQAAKNTEETQEEEVEPVPEEPIPVGRDWYNLVCYGLPNLIVSQLTK